MFYNNHLTPEIYQDGLEFLDETQLHCIRASHQAKSSYPYQEPWYMGPPKFTYYSQVDIPFYRVNCNLTTDPNCDLTRNIYIPPTGIPKSKIVDKIIGLIIGKNGYWLKRLTYETKLHYIWYNKTYGVFEIWGSPNTINYASYKITQHIENVIDQYNINSP